MNSIGDIGELFFVSSFFLRRRTDPIYLQPKMYGDISGYNNGKGGGGGKRAVAGPADFYRRVPREMTEVFFYIVHILCSLCLSLQISLLLYILLSSHIHYIHINLTVNQNRVYNVNNITFINGHTLHL